MIRRKLAGKRTWLAETSYPASQLFRIQSPHFAVSEIR